MNDERPAPDATKPDPYEQKYMAGEGAVVLRDKMRVPWFFHALFMLPMLIVLGLPFVDPAAGFGPYLTLPLLAAAWSVFSTLRVVVSEEQVHIQYGLFGPRIPVRDIVKAEAESYNWMKYGGYGIRKGLDGTTAYNLIGDKGQGVRIHWRDAKGRVKKVLISSEHPERLARAINTARAKQGAWDGDLAAARANQALLDAPSAETVPASVEPSEQQASVSGSSNTERD